MQREDARPRGPASILTGYLIIAALVIILIDKASVALMEKQKHLGRLPKPYLPLLPFLNRYLGIRYFITDHKYWLGLLGIVSLTLLLIGLKKGSAMMHRLRERSSGLAFKEETYAFKKIDFDLLKEMRKNPSIDEQIFIGLNDKKNAPVYLPDHDRMMHTHVLGQTGSGKTKSAIETMLFQDVLRGRGVIFLDGKGSQDNQERFIAISAACGRLSNTKVFSLSPFAKGQKINCLHLGERGDPLAVAERNFAACSVDMENPYYKDQSAMFFKALIRAFADTGKRFAMDDISAAMANREVLEEGLRQSSDGKAKREIWAQLDRLGSKAGETLSGLAAAVARYNVPSVNAYDPDIILEEDIAEGRVLGFFLPVNYYKQLARYIGLMVLQHVQQVGALRQLNRSINQRSIFLYADEYSSFLSEDFIHTLSKSRDANLGILLANQSFADLEQISESYAVGIWDNTRTKFFFYQNDKEICDRYSTAIGTRKTVRHTTRWTVDRFLNPFSTLEASSREVDEFICHPNRIKNLACGQALVSRDSTFVGVNMKPLPESIFTDFKDAEIPAPKEQNLEGLGLRELILTIAFKVAK